MKGMSPIVTIPPSSPTPLKCIIHVLLHRLPVFSLSVSANHELPSKLDFSVIASVAVFIHCDAQSLVNMSIPWDFPSKRGHCQIIWPLTGIVCQHFLIAYLSWREPPAMMLFAIATIPEVQEDSYMRDICANLLIEGFSMVPTLCDVISSHLLRNPFVIVASRDVKWSWCEVLVLQSRIVHLHQMSHQGACTCVEQSVARWPKKGIAPWIGAKLDAHLDGQLFTSPAQCIFAIWLHMLPPVFPAAFAVYIAGFSARNWLIWCDTPFRLHTIPYKHYSLSRHAHLGHIWNIATWLFKKDLVALYKMDPQTASWARTNGVIEGTQWYSYICSPNKSLPHGLRWGHWFHWNPKGDPANL